VAALDAERDQTAGGTTDLAVKIFVRVPQALVTRYERLGISMRRCVASEAGADRLTKQRRL
jgi:hypothetical protein